jgi:hypothetical protein
MKPVTGKHAEKFIGYLPQVTGTVNSLAVEDPSDQM